MTTRVTVVGDALLDVHVRHAAPIRRGSDIPAAVAIGIGGQGANVAVRLARRGADVGLVCALGTDAAGDLVRAALRTDGVRVHEVAAERTGAVIVLGDGTGERSMLSQRSPFATGAAKRLRDEPDWLVVSGYLLLEPTADLVRTVRGMGARRMLVGCAVPDDAIRPWRMAARALRPDLLVLNRDELERLGPDLDAVGLAVTSSAGARVTVGELSVAATTPAGPPALDTTGAGDAFAAALLACLAGSWPPGVVTLRRAVADAVELAAAVARVRGAQAHAPGERR